MPNMYAKYVRIIASFVPCHVHSVALHHSLKMTFPMRGLASDFFKMDENVEDGNRVSPLICLIDRDVTIGK